MDNVNEIYVYENWKSDTPSLIGTLYVDGGKGKQVVSFEYDDVWLNDLTNNVTLDPDLKMFKGRQYAPTDKLMFGLSEVRALEELMEIKNVVESNWRKLAGQYGLSRSEIEGIAPAFNMSFKG